MSKYIIVEIDDEALELMRKNGDESKELIQCKDCTHSREIKPFGATELCCMRWGLFAVEPNGYCDRSERKKNERKHRFQRVGWKERKEE